MFVPRCTTYTHTHTHTHTHQNSTTPVCKIHSFNMLPWWKWIERNSRWWSIIKQLSSNDSHLYSKIHVVGLKEIWWKNWLYNFIERLIYRKDHSVAASEFLKSTYGFHVPTKPRQSEQAQVISKVKYFSYVPKGVISWLSCQFLPKIFEIQIQFMKEKSSMIETKDHVFWHQEHLCFCPVSPFY